MKKITLTFLLFVFVWGVLLQKKAIAGEISLTKESQNVIIVMDYSGSMISHDRQGNLPNIMAAILETLEGEDIHIGFVAYNDTILTNYPLTPLGGGDGVEQLKITMENTPYEGETDIGLGLRTAYQMLEGISGGKSILLLSDGETDLKVSTEGRSKEDSEKDIEEVIRLCQESEITISTVGFGEQSNKKQLEVISERTKGQSYNVSVPGELVTVLSNIFFSKLSISVKELGTSVYGAGTQKITYKGSNADSIRIFLLSESQLKGIEIIDQYAQKTIELPEDSFTAAQIENEQSNFTISFTTKEQQKVWVYAIEERKVVPFVRWPDGIHINDGSTFVVNFGREESNSFLEDYEVDKLDWEAVMVSKDTREGTPIQLTVKQNELSGTVYFKDAGEYMLNIRGRGGIGDRYVCPKITAENSLPESSMTQTIELFTFSGEKTIDLQEYIVDSDGDRLTYTLQQVPSDVIEATLENSKLTISPVKRGSGEIRLLASDGEGRLAIGLFVKINGLWEACFPVLILLLVICVFISWRMYRKKQEAIPLPVRIEEKTGGSFTGKLNAHFTRLPEGIEEVPPLSFSLYPIREKKIVLKDMFAAYPELVTMLELDKIFFFPAESREMIFYQESDLTVMVGNSLVCRRMQYMISYGNVIYITSKDGKCELEVHYIAMI